MRQAQVVRQGKTARIECRIETNDQEAAGLLEQDSRFRHVGVEGGLGTWICNGNGSIGPGDLTPIIEQFLRVNGFEVQAVNANGSTSLKVYALLDDIDRENREAS